MKTMKKIMALALTFCLAFAGVLSSKGVVANATVDENGYAVVSGGIQVRVNNEVGNGTNKYVAKISGGGYVATLKVNSKGVATIGKWEKTDTNGKAVVSVNPAKDTYFAVKKGANEAYVKLNKAAKTKFYGVVKYDVKGYEGRPIAGISDSKGGNLLASEEDSNQEDTGSEYKFDTQYASFSYGDEAAGGILVNDAAGQTVYGVVKTPVCKDAKNGASSDATLKSGKKIKIETIGTADSKLVKIKVPKRPNAPGATINYLKGTASIPKGCAFRIVDNSGEKLLSGDASFEANETFFDNKSAASTKYEIKDLSVYGAGYLEVLKQAKGKRASKIRAVPFGTATEFNAASGGALSFAQEFKGSDKYNVIVTNASSDGLFEYYNATAKKWVKIPVAKSSKKGTATIKGVASGDSIYVRVQGNAANLELPGVSGNAYTVQQATPVTVSYEATATSTSADAAKDGKLKVKLMVASAEATGAWEGKIVDTSIKGKIVTIDGKKYYDVASGVYTFEGLKAGTYTIKIKWDKDNAKKYGPVTDVTATVPKGTV